MRKKVLMVMAIPLGAMMVIGICVISWGQEQPTVTLRYQAKVGDVWQYECVTESETDRSTISFNSRGEKINSTGTKYLKYVKEKYNYNTLEITPDGCFKIQLTQTTLESKGVFINKKTDKKDEKYYSAGNERKAPIIVNDLGEWLTDPKKERVGGVITGALLMPYESMIKYFYPVMPANPVKIDDTWNYKVVIIPIGLPEIINIIQDMPSSVTYKAISFCSYEGFNCIRINYNYNVDYTEKFNEERAKNVQSEIAKTGQIPPNQKGGQKITGLGTLYFAYNEGLLISKKENMIMTYAESELINNEWQEIKKDTERIGFTMHYIKP